MQKEVTHAQLLEILRSRVKAGTLTQLAKDMGVSVSFMGEIVRGQKLIPGTISLRLGYQRLVVYRKVA